jgi:hypothetical protein
VNTGDILGSVLSGGGSVAGDLLGSVLGGGSKKKPQNAQIVIDPEGICSCWLVLTSMSTPSRSPSSANNHY